MMPGRMASPREMRPRRLRRISSRTGRMRYPEAFSSPTVRASWATTRAEYTHGARRHTTRKACARGGALRERRERAAEPLPRIEEMLRHHPRVGEHRHEVRVPAPARHDVPMQMIGEA